MASKRQSAPGQGGAAPLVSLPHPRSLAAPIPSAASDPPYPVIYLIFLHLLRQDALTSSALLVCRAYYRIGLPMLYRYVNLKLYKFHQLLHPLGGDLDQPLEMHADLRKSIDSKAKALKYVKVVSINSLERALELRKWSREQSHLINPHKVATEGEQPPHVRAFPNLEHVHLERYLVEGYGYNYSFPDVPLEPKELRIQVIDEALGHQLGAAKSWCTDMPSDSACDVNFETYYSILHRQSIKKAGWELKYLRPPREGGLRCTDLMGHLSISEEVSDIQRITFHYYFHDHSLRNIERTMDNPPLNPILPLTPNRSLEVWYDFEFDNINMTRAKVLKVWQCFISSRLVSCRYPRKYKLRMPQYPDIKEAVGQLKYWQTEEEPELDGYLDLFLEHLEFRDVHEECPCKKVKTFGQRKWEGRCLRTRILMGERIRRRGFK